VNLSEILMSMPCWYLFIALLICLYHGVRGIVEHSVYYEQGRSYLNHGSSQISTTKKIIILYIQDFLFKFITVMSGFVALFIAMKIFPSSAEINNIGIGNAMLIIFLFVWGILGVGGPLTRLIVEGKFLLINK